MSWLVFAWKLCFLNFGNDSPDIVIVSSPSLISCLAAETLARKAGAKFVFEFRDIWPDSIVELGKLSKFNPAIWLLYKLEKRAMIMSDHIIHTMEGGKQYVEAKSGQGKKCIWIPNGEIDTKFTNVHSKTKNLFLSDVWSKKNFTITYLGTFGLANSIDTIIKAAVILKDFESIKFILVGSGPLKETLKAQINDNRLKNVHILPYASGKLSQSILDSSSATIICWKDLEIYLFGTSAAKFSTYLKAGKPIIQAYSGSFDYVKKYNLGVSVPAENPEALAKQITKMKEMSPKRLENFGNRAKGLYESSFRYNKIIKRLERIFDNNH